jgi:predicted outer membrane repeat protein
MRGTHAVKKLMSPIRSARVLARRLALLAALVIPAHAIAQPIDMDLGIDNDTKYQALRTALLKAEFVRTDHSLAPNNRIAASTTALLVFASLNPLATEAEFQAFLMAYDDALWSFDGDDPDLRRPSNYLAALRTLERVGAATEFPGLDTRVGPRVRELLGISVRQPTASIDPPLANAEALAGRMVDYENARAMSPTNSPVWARALILGFYGQDLDGEPNDRIAPVLEGYLLAEGYTMPVLGGSNPPRFNDVVAEITNPTDDVAKMPLTYASFVARLGNLGQDDASFDDNPFRNRIQPMGPGAGGAIGSILGNIDAVYQQIEGVTGAHYPSLQEAANNATMPEVVGPIETQYEQNILAVSGARTGVTWASTLIRQSPNPAAQDYADKAANLSASLQEASEVMSGVRSGIELVAGIGTFAAGYKGGDPANMIGGASSAALAAMDLAELFGAPGFETPPSIEEQMFDQITEMRMDLFEIAGQLNERFDQIESKLNDVYSTMNTQFANLEDTLEDIDGDIDTLIGKIARAQSSLDLLVQELWNVANVLLEADFYNAVESFIGRVARGSALPNADFDVGASAFLNFTVNVANNASYAGDDPSTFDDPDDALSTIAGDAFGRHINDLRNLASTVPGVTGIPSARVVGPDAWAQGASAYAQLMRENPWYHANRVAAGGGDAALLSIIAKGEALSSLTRSLRNPNLLQSLLSDYAEAAEAIAVQEEAIIADVGTGPYGYTNPFDEQTEFHPDVAAVVQAVEPFSCVATNVPHSCRGGYDGTYILPYNAASWNVLGPISDDPEGVLALLANVAEARNTVATVDVTWDSGISQFLGDVDVYYRFELHVNANVPGHPEFQAVVTTTYYCDMEGDWAPYFYGRDDWHQHNRLEFLVENWMQFAHWLHDAPLGSSIVSAPFRSVLEWDNPNSNIGCAEGGPSEYTFRLNSRGTFVTGNPAFHDLQSRVWDTAREHPIIIAESDKIRNRALLLDAYTTVAAPSVIDENAVVRSALRTPPGPDNYGLAVDWLAHYDDNLSDLDSATFLWPVVNHNLGVVSQSLSDGVSDLQGATRSGHGYLEWMLAELRDLRDHALDLAIDDRYLAGGELQVSDPALGLLANDVRQRTIDGSYPITVNIPAGARSSSYVAPAWDTPAMDGQVVADVTINEDGTFTFVPSLHAYEGPAYFNYHTLGSVGDIGGAEQLVLSNPATVRVDIDLDNPTFINVPTDCPTVAEALALIADDPSSVIELAPGIYREHLTLPGKAFTLRSSTGNPEDVILSGDLDGDGVGDGRVIRCNSGEGPDTRFEHITIADGWAPQVGGGAYITAGSAPAFVGCRFVNNTSDVDGGAVYTFTGAAPTFTDCVFEGNHANGSGGALYNNDATATLLRCSLTNNTAVQNGGAIFNRDGGRPTITDSLIADNTAGGDGGGMHTADSLGVFSVRNTTFAGNSAGGVGGGVRNAPGAEVGYTGCVFAANTPDQIDNASDTTPFAYCAVQGGLPAFSEDQGGNLDTDPMFLDALAGDYRLAPGSPCIDAGSNRADGPGNDCDTNGVNDAIELGHANLPQDLPDNPAALKRETVSGFGLTEFTVELWFRKGIEDGAVFSYNGPATDSEITIFDVGSLNIAAGGVFQFTSFDAEAAGTVGDWNHLSVSWRSSDGMTSVRVNGAEVQSYILNPGDTIPDGGRVYLGQEQDAAATNPDPGLDPTQAFIGDLRQVRFWSVYREPGEVAADYTLALTGAEPGLVSYWPLDDGSGSIAADLAGPNTLELVPGAAFVDLDTNDDGFPDGCPAVLDLAGSPRYVDDPDTPDTGAGSAPIIDMGPYEFVPSGCPGDIDGDGDTDIFDFAILADVFGLAMGDAQYDGRADLTGDDAVDIFDFGAFADDFGCGLE